MRVGVIFDIAHNMLLSVEYLILSGVTFFLVRKVCMHGVLIILSPGFPFWILSRSFGERSKLQDKSGTESLGSRLVF